MDFEEKKKNIRIEIGNNIKKYREQKKLTKAEFATKLSSICNKEIARSSITAWEKGIYSPDLGLINGIANVLDTSISNLISDNVTSNSQIQNSVTIVDNSGISYSFYLQKEQLEYVKQLLTQMREENKNA